jgi:DNA-binding GntR family transcriptional regulator
VSDNTAILRNTEGNRASLAQAVYDELRKAIRAGRYSGGGRIREEEVAKALGVSRTPVREALLRLQSRGMVEPAVGGLAVVQLSRSQVVELYAMREMLEGAAARFAAERASPSEIALLRHVLGMFEHALAIPDKLPEINRHLHAAIYEIAHNRYLAQSLEQLHDSLTLLPDTTFAVEGRPKEAFSEHSRIVEAIERRDPDAADRAAREHIKKAEALRLAMLFGFA